MTFQRATALAIAALVRRLAPACAHRRGRLRSEPRATTPTNRPTRSTRWCAAKASTRSGRCCARSSRAATCGRSPGSRIGARARWSTIPNRAVARLASEPLALPDRGARVLDGLHAARPARRRRRDVARLHLRLQLLLDHRDARAQLPPLSDRSRAGRHRRCQATRRPGHLPGRRQHHARRPALRARCARRSSPAGCTTRITSSRR